MKVFVFLIGVIFATIAASVSAKEVFNPNENFYYSKDESIYLGEMKLQIARSGKLTDTILLLSSGPPDDSDLTNDEYFQRVINFYISLLQDRKIEKMDRPKLGFAIFKSGKGFLNNVVFTIDSNVLSAFNNSDLSTTGLSTEDAAKKLKPVKAALKKLIVLDVIDFKTDKERTMAFQNYLKTH